MNRVLVNVARVLKEKGAEEEFNRSLELSPIEKDSGTVRFDGPVETKLTIQNMGEELLVSGHVSGKLSLTCSRCLCDFDLTAEFDISDLYSTDSEDADTRRFVGEEIDLGPALDEGFILEVPIAPLCDVACKGLCSACGGNLNITECHHELENFDERLSDLKKWFDKQEKGE